MGGEHSERREKYEAGLKKRRETLSAFLLAAKLRIDVSRSIQRAKPVAPPRLTAVKTPHRASCQKTGTAKWRIEERARAFCNILPEENGANTCARGLRENASQISGRTNRRAFFPYYSIFFTINFSFLC